MSSYVIGKQEYIKAAGIVAGLARGLQLWIFDYKAGHNMDAAGFYQQFSDFYTMNALSVQEQYRDQEPDTDSNTYEDVFKKAEKAGYSIAVTRENLKETILELRQFFHSAMYQVEKDEYMFAIDYFTGRILTALLPYMLPGYETKSWGSLEIAKTKNVQTLF